MARWIMSAAIAAIALQCQPASAGALQDDLKGRRARLMERLGPHALFIAWSAPVRQYSRDVDYEYRQDSNLYYLTGIEQDQTILVLMPGNRTRKAILFVREPDPVREHWEGHDLTTSEAQAVSGADVVYFTRQFEPFIDAMLSRRPYDQPRDRATAEYETFFGALRDGAARLALILDPKPGLAGSIDSTMAFANRVRERFLGVSVVDATDWLRDLRQVKTAHERAVLEKSVDISSEAHLAGMRAARPGTFEYEVEAAIEAVYLARGALGWGYPSIVASGPNATILHYDKSRRQMEAGDLLLVDAAANYEYMTGDITRTYPVSGTFTDRQKDIYRIVLAAQDEAIKAARAGVSLADIHFKTVEVIKAGLLTLGLITDPAGDQYRIWYTHGACHFIGLDVHDVGDRDGPLQPGAAFTIEPGIYVREGALDNLPQNAENAAFIERVRPVYEKYRNIGVRIEDSFLLTESGLTRLSARVPRTIEEVEAFMRSRGTVPSSR